MNRLVFSLAPLAPMLRVLTKLKSENKIKPKTYEQAVLGLKSMKKNGGNNHASGN